MAAITDTAVDHAQAQAALRREVARVAKLLRDMPIDGRGPMLGAWDALDAATHLSQAFLVVPALAAGDLAPVHELVPDWPERDSGWLLGHLRDLDDFTVAGVRAAPERDPAVLAERLERRAADFLADVARRPDGEARPWLVEGITVRPTAFTCHLLNEAVVHGRDIAVGAGLRWKVDRASAALVLDGFLMPVAGALGAAMLDPTRGAGIRACYDLRIRGGGRHFLVFGGGTFAVEPPSDRPVDCRLSVDPAAFLLLAWARTGQWGAIARGQLLAWGRKPWLGLRLRSLVRNP